VHGGGDERAHHVAWIHKLSNETLRAARRQLAVLLAAAIKVDDLSRLAVGSARFLRLRVVPVEVHLVDEVVHVDVSGASGEAVSEEGQHVPLAQQARVRRECLDLA
jgi:hypothetical protein